MPVLKPTSVEIFNRYSSLMYKCRREVSALAWFGESNWWLNLSFGNQGFTFQLSKTHWFNHNGRGIHFEFWLSEPEDRQKTLPFVLHFEADTPQRKALGNRFKTAFAQYEHDFSDYTINHAALSDKMQKTVKFTKKSLPQLVVEEFTRLQKIAPVIDGILS